MRVDFPNELNHPLACSKTNDNGRLLQEIAGHSNRFQDRLSNPGQEL
jgi:hypothetical protein